MTDTRTKIEELLRGLTPRRKMELLAQAGPAYGYLPERGIPGTVPQDVPRGGADISRAGRPRTGPDGRPVDGAYHPVALPATSAVGMSWDIGLAYQIGALFAREAKANPDRVDMLNRPGMNLKRSPLCGRNYDYLSEDPVHTGKMAAAYIRGIQSEGIAACPKHFIANNQEYERMTGSSEMDLRTFHEVYLRAWEIALGEGKPRGVMTSYNKVNGEWVNESELCMRALREELCYDGFVVSDFLAIHENKVRAHAMGVDTELAPVEDHTQQLIDAYERGEISEAEIDRAVRHIMELYDWTKDTLHGEALDMERLHLEARELAKQCMVLLRNDGCLPLTAKTGRILVSGELAEAPTTEGSGSGYMNGYLQDSPLEEIRRLAAKEGLETDYARGYRMTQTTPPSGNAPDPDLLAAFTRQAGDAGIVLLFVGSPYGWESEGYDRADTRLPANQQALLEAALAAGKPVVLVLTGGSVWDLGEAADRLSAILYAGFTGEAFGGAAAELLFGQGEPGGRLTETFPLMEEHGPAYLDFSRAGRAAELTRYTEGLHVGYRWYDARKLPVRFPFGHGLSYTTFSCGDICADRRTLAKGQTVTVQVTVKNQGERPGSQVIQLYAAKKGGYLQSPEKELKAFAKVWLAPGEERQVYLSLAWEELKVFDPGAGERGEWCVEGGAYELLPALSAGDILERIPIQVESADRPFRYTRWTALERFVREPAFHRYLEEKGCPEEFRSFFDSGKNEFLILMYPLPVYRLGEPVPGGPQAMFAGEELEALLAYMNRESGRSGRPGSHPFEEGGGA